MAARTASIEGPASLRVGQVGTYSVSGLDGRQVLWTVESAAVSTETATITPRSPGLVTLTVTVEDETLVRQITVVP